MNATKDLQNRRNKHPIYLESKIKLTFLSILCRTEQLFLSSVLKNYHLITMESSIRWACSISTAATAEFFKLRGAYNIKFQFARNVYQQSQQLFFCSLGYRQHKEQPVKEKGIDHCKKRCAI